MGEPRAMADNSWAVNDFNATLAPLSIGGGIYDFSGTVPDHVYAEDERTKPGITKDEIGLMAKAWWDGSSAGWSSDADFGDLCKTGHKLKGMGLTCTMMRRSAFGEGDSCHLVTAQYKKKGIIVAHADYTCIVGIFDAEDGKPAGPLAMQIEDLCKMYKDQGY